MSCKRDMCGGECACEDNVDSVYLDYNATTPTDCSVNETIYRTLTDAWGNPSSGYSAGVKAKKAIDKARASVAKMMGTVASNILFTSGGTESNNMVFYSCVKQCLTEWGCKPHIISTAIEHPSVKLPLETLVANGEADVTFVCVNAAMGSVRVDDVMKHIQDNTCLISVMLANNETGVVQPVGEICQAVEEYRKERGMTKRILVHTDAAQVFGKLPVSVEQLGVDYMTIVGHKVHDQHNCSAVVHCYLDPSKKRWFYGPRIGALYVSGLGDGTPLHPMLYGGGQERGYRPGTENTAMIAGLGQAAQLVCNNIIEYEKHLRDVRDYLEERLQAVFKEKVVFNCRSEHNQRLPNTCNMSFVGKNLEGYRVLSACKHLIASTGAACHSQNGPSSILTASGVPSSLARNALRLSVGRETSRADVDRVIEDLLQALSALDKQST